MFSEPSDESAICMAIAFRASLRHFSLLTELKAQFNHDGVISTFGSPLSMKHSSISLNRFRMRLAREPGAGSGEREVGKKRAGSRDCRKKSRNR
jgi:hypothetical protein